MKKIVCQFFGVFPDTENLLSSGLHDYHVSIAAHALRSPADVDPSTQILGVFVDSRIDKAIMDRLPVLRLIVTMSTGYDHIDVAYAAARGVTVANVPTYGENTVAEHALALILALSRRLYPSIKRVKEGEFHYDGLEGFDLKGKTAGIIGTGHIGAHVIRMLRGFEMNVVAFDAFPNPDLARSLGFSYTSLNQLLSSSDIISLHVPLFKQTRHLISKSSILKMKRGVYIINTARGGLIDHEALLWGLSSGHVAGAGLDVLEAEDTLQHPDHLVLSQQSARDIKLTLMQRELINHPQVIVTPHNAFNSREALERIIVVTIENILDFSAGAAKNIVLPIKKK
jgi:D-lactate dehydrogenase